jgi:hypothetical protein
VVEAGDANAVKAAVIYYGTGPVTEFRRDLPLLWVRAGLDRPAVNDDISRLASLAVAQNAPVTLLNHSTGYHGFELFNDDDATREVIDRTLQFVRRATAHAYRAALGQRLTEAAAAGNAQTGRFREAATIYAQLIQAKPNDARLALSYGEALLGDGQYSAACSTFGPLRGKGLGARDLGVPAARACARAGEAETAIEWIRSIPPRFRPATLLTDSSFTALRERPEFRALFP